jgi:hypothetical protein
MSPVYFIWSSFHFQRLHDSNTQLSRFHRQSSPSWGWFQAGWIMVIESISQNIGEIFLWFSFFLGSSRDLAALLLSKLLHNSFVIFQSFYARPMMHSFGKELHCLSRKRYRHRSGHISLITRRQYHNTSHPRYCPLPLKCTPSILRWSKQRSNATHNAPERLSYMFLLFLYTFSIPGTVPSTRPNVFLSSHFQQEHHGTSCSCLPSILS